MAASAYLGFFLFVAVAMFFGWLVYGPIRELATDIGRQSLFKIRDRLFNLAASGHISFTDPDYVEFRRTLNRCARYAHQISVRQIFMGAMLMPNPDPDQGIKVRMTRLEGKVRDQASKKEVRDCGVWAAATLTFILLFRSPVTLVVALMGLSIYLLGCLGVAVCRRALTDCAGLIRALVHPRPGQWVLARIAVILFAASACAQASAKAADEPLVMMRSA